MVYDVKNNQSFDNIEYWIEVVSKVKENSNKILIYILANKNDKSDGNANTQIILDGKSLAADYKYMFKSISAKDNDGILGLIEDSVNNYLAIP